LVPAKVPEHEPYQLIIFSGHGYSDRLGFCRAGENRDEDAVSNKQFAKCIKKYSDEFSPQVAVVLNACDTGTLGALLVRVGISRVICTTGKLADSIAVKYPAALVHYVAKKYSVSEAHQHAVDELPEAGARIYLLREGATGRQPNLANLPSYMACRVPLMESEYENDREINRVLKAVGGKQRLVPRVYQEEMVEFATSPSQSSSRSGQLHTNTVVCLPTGAGKTLVAAHVLDDHASRECNWDKVSIVICETIILVFQHSTIY
jgi:hypothetical protein